MDKWRKWTDFASPNHPTCNNAGYFKMVRKRNEKALEMERQMEKAVQEVLTRKVKNANQAAKKFGVHWSTLSNRLAGGLTRREAPASQQTLFKAEEKVLQKWCSHLTAAEYSAGLVVLREMAETLIAWCVTKSTLATPIIQPRPLGIDWAKRFIKRHPNLKNTRSIQIDLSRWSDPTADVIQGWYDAFRDASVSRHVATENIYNMDETGFGLGIEESTRVIIDSTLRTRYKV